MLDMDRSQEAPKQPRAGAAASPEMNPTPQGLSVGPRGVTELPLPTLMAPSPTHPDQASVALQAEQSVPQLPVAIAQEPLTWEGRKALRARINDGVISPEELKEEFARFMEQKPSISADFLAMKKQDVIRSCGIDPGGRLAKATQKEIVESVMEFWEKTFLVKECFSWSPFEETHDEALTRVVNAQTAEDIQKHAAGVAQARSERTAAVEQYKRAVEDPQTKADFDIFLEVKGREALNPDQKARYDELASEEQREKERQNAERAREISRPPATVIGGGDYEMELHAGRHTKTNVPIWTVSMGKRVERDVYDAVLDQAKQRGGYYSSYRGNGAIAGFIFKEEGAAKEFMALYTPNESAETAPSLPESSESKSVPVVSPESHQPTKVVVPKSSSAKVGDKFREMADAMHAKAEAVLNADRKTNTHKRAAQASHTEGEARKQQAMAQTLRNIADRLDAGQAKHLTGITTRAQVETLGRILDSAQRDHLTERRNAGEHIRFEEAMREPANMGDVDYAKYPYPVAYADNMERLVGDAEKKPGAKRAAARLRRFAQTHARGNGRVVFDNADLVDDWRTVAAALPTTDYTYKQIKEYMLDNYSRMQSAGIKTPEQLRSALREFLPLKALDAGEDPIRTAERSLIGAKIPGYFPTPTALASEVISKAEIEPGMRVLEPSAGKGSLIDEIYRQVGKEGIQVEAIEPVYSLRSILEAKGHTLVGHDIMEHTDEVGYDRIVMNPPFENGQDIDHVQKSYDLLKPGGRLVAIMGEGAFGRGDRKATEFREWLSENEGIDEKNPDGSFLTSDRSTGVSTRTVVLDKPGGTLSLQPVKAEPVVEDPLAGAAKGPVADELRALMDLNRAQISAYKPEESILKFGSHWSFREVRGNESQASFSTKKEALEGAESHLALLTGLYLDPGDYSELIGRRARKWLELEKSYRGQGMSELTAAAAANKEMAAFSASFNARPVQEMDLDEYRQAVSEGRAGSDAEKLAFSMINLYREGPAENLQYARQRFNQMTAEAHQALRPVEQEPEESGIVAGLDEPEAVEESLELPSEEVALADPDGASASVEAFAGDIPEPSHEEQELEEMTPHSESGDARSDQKIQKLRELVEAQGGRSKVAENLKQMRQSGDTFLMANFEASLRTMEEMTGLSRAEVLAEFGLKEVTREKRPSTPKESLPHAGEGEAGDFSSSDPNSLDYRFRDTGYIAGSRKELAAKRIRDAAKLGEQVSYQTIDWEEIEKNPREARDLITKSNLFGKVDWEACRANGMVPEAGFIMDRVYAAISAEPTEDSPQARQDYSQGLDNLRERMEVCKTVDQVSKELDEILREFEGVSFNASEAERYMAAKERYDEIRGRSRALRVEQSNLEQDRNLLLNDVRTFEREKAQTGRRKKEWDADAEAYLEKKRQALKVAEEVLQAWNAAHPECQERPVKVNSWTAFRSELDEQAIPYRQAMKAIEAEAKARNAVENPIHRAWHAMGDRFIGVLKYRSDSGSLTFAKQMTAAKAGKPEDWSWAEKVVKKREVTATMESTRFQLLVADKWDRSGGMPVGELSSVELKEMFNLRDAQYGNYVARDLNSAKGHTEWCAAGLSDLADLIGVERNQVGLNGRLAMAFGARGNGASGWRTSAPAASYEAKERVINLTKMAGGGTLAHEWFHSLDNILHDALGSGVSGKESYFTKTPELMPEGPVRDALVDLRKAMLDGPHRNNVEVEYTERDLVLAKHNVDSYYAGRMGGPASIIKNAKGALEAIADVRDYFHNRRTDMDRAARKRMNEWVRMAAAYHDKNPAGGTVVVAAGDPVSSFFLEAENLDRVTKSKTPYWSQPNEMAARAFEAWALNSLRGMGRQNTYLVDKAENKYYVDPFTGAPLFPYPVGEESQRINAAFDGLFTALREAGAFER